MEMGNGFLPLRSQRRGQRSNHRLISIVMSFTPWVETPRVGETDYLD